MGDRVHIGRAVHGQNALFGQYVVHGREHALFDLTGILGAADDNEVRLVVNHNGRFGMDAVYGGIAVEAGGGNDRIVGLPVSRQLFRGRPDQQVTDEQVLGGQFIDHAELLGILGIGAGKAVKNKDLSALEVSANLRQNGIETLLGDGAVHLAPGDVVMNGRGVDNKLVVRGAARVLAGGNDQRAGIAQLSLTPAPLPSAVRGQGSDRRRWDSKFPVFPDHRFP